MQGAQELAKEIIDDCSEEIYGSIQRGTALIRARDKGIVEECKRKGEDYMPNKAVWVDWCDALDSVLRDHD